MFQTFYLLILVKNRTISQIAITTNIIGFVNISVAVSNIVGIKLKTLCNRSVGVVVLIIFQVIYLTF